MKGSWEMREMREQGAGSRGKIPLLCNLPHARCPMPDAPCPMPYLIF
ncbi:MAG: hypothetical protein V7L05_03870 [Nostoc sp.]